MTPAALYGHLLPEGAVDSALRTEAASFRHGRAALQIHVALSAPLSWCDKRLAEIPLIHLSDGSASTGIACAEAEAGLLPRRPTVVVGPTAALLSWTRAFYGAHSPRRAATRPRLAGSGTSALRPIRERVSAASPGISSRPR